MPRAQKSPSSYRSHGLAIASADRLATLTRVIENFKLGMAKFVAMFCDNYGLKLVFRGTDACTDGKTIYVPELSLFSRSGMTNAEVDDAMQFLQTTRGYIYHEGAHVIFSTFTEVRAALTHGGPKFKFLVNALEDIRVEYKVSAVYPGARESLIFMNDWSSARIAKSKDEMHPYVQVVFALMQLGALSSDANNDLWKKLPKFAKDFAQSCTLDIEQAKHAASTRDVLAIAKRIWSRLIAMAKEEEERAPKPPKTKAGKAALESDEKNSGDGAEPEEAEGAEDSTDGASADGDDEAEPEEAEDTEEDSTDDASADGDDEAEPEEAEDEPASASADDAEEAEEVEEAEDGEKDILELSSDDEVKAPSLETAMHEVAERAVEAPGEPGAYRVFSTENDVIGPPDGNFKTPAMHASYTKLDESVRFAYGPVKRTLESLLKAQARTFYLREQEDGELDQDNLYKLALARKNPRMREQARNVFMHAVKTSSLKNTACSLLIDESGSMGHSGSSRWGDSKSLLATKAALVFAHALDSVNIPFEVLAFTSGEFRTSARMMARCTPAARRAYTRFGALQVDELKRFDQPWYAVKEQILAINGYRANYDGESVKLAAQRLMQRKESRRILFVLSDGLPGPDVDESEAEQCAYLHTVVREIRTTTPIELIGIGIMAIEVKEFYQPQFVNVHNAQELPSVVISQLKAVLLNR